MFVSCVTNLWCLQVSERHQFTSLSTVLRFFFFWSVFNDYLNHILYILLFLFVFMFFFFWSCCIVVIVLLCKGKYNLLVSKKELAVLPLRLCARVSTETKWCGWVLVWLKHLFIWWRYIHLFSHGRISKREGAYSVNAHHHTGTTIYIMYWKKNTKPLPVRIRYNKSNKYGMTGVCLVYFKNVTWTLNAQYWPPPLTKPAFMEGC